MKIDFNFVNMTLLAVIKDLEVRPLEITMLISKIMTVMGPLCYKR